MPTLPVSASYSRAAFNDSVKGEGGIVPPNFVSAELVRKAYTASQRVFVSADLLGNAYTASQ